MVNTRHTNLGQNNIQEDVESIGPEARIANLNQQLAQAQKNVEDLLAQNAVLLAARTPAPSQHVEGGDNSRMKEDPPPPPSTEAERRLQRMVQDLGAKYDVLSKTVAEKQEEVANAALPEKFKIPDIPIFTGSEDPMEHLMAFRSHTSLHKTPDIVVCRAFPLTLSRKAQDWLRNLLPRSIDSFDTLGQKFLTQFVSGREKLDTESAPDDFIYSAIFQGLKKDGPFMAKLALKPPKDLHAFMINVDRYINQEETLRAFASQQERKLEPPSSGKSSKKKKSEAGQDSTSSDYKKVKKNFGDYKWTPLNATITEVIMCISMRQLIEKFIENGKLVRFLVGEKRHQDLAQAPRPREEEERRHRIDYASRQEERRERGREPSPRPREERRERSRSRVRDNDNIPIIHTISGGFGGGGGESSSARKLMLDSWKILRCIRCESLQKPEDAVLWSLGFRMKIMPEFTPAYRRPCCIIDYCQLSTSANTGEKVSPLGSIELPVITGTYPRQKVIMIKFLIVDRASAYNAIFGRTALNKLKAVTSTLHLSMKFPTPEGVGVVKGD
ncbi:uncharacterized protein LOC133876849 [Alnus glutinosa]|uniref:uncharacterized protein LOC133876849 n=1 Tax=Alnus glutinosa TaxID=3517 RepID=UPI002D7960D3|nr:uncharacterized protein LOC133876849 [Alnus glutinosa]